jgi:hypothetical protein
VGNRESEGYGIKFVLEAYKSIISILGGLLETLVGHHFVLDGNQDVLYRGCFLPSFEYAQVLYSSVVLVD